MKTTEITFNKDNMTVKDLKLCASSLQHILHMFDTFEDNPEEFVLRVAQVRMVYNPNA